MAEFADVPPEAREAFALEIDSGWGVTIAAQCHWGSPDRLIMRNLAKAMAADTAELDKIGPIEGLVLARDLGIPYAQLLRMIAERRELNELLRVAAGRFAPKGSHLGKTPEHPRRRVDAELAEFWRLYGEHVNVGDEVNMLLPVESFILGLEHTAFVHGGGFEFNRKGGDTRTTTQGTLRRALDELRSCLPPEAKWPADKRLDELHTLALARKERMHLETDPP